MSKSGPTTLIVVGDTDWWGRVRRQLRYDSRLRRLAGTGQGGQYWNAYSAGSRTPAAGISWYFEFTWINGTSAAAMQGILREDLTATYFEGGAVHLGAFWHNADGIGAQQNGDIRYSNAVQQSGLPPFAFLDRIGVKLYMDGGTQKVQFYKNKDPWGAAVAITAGAYAIAYCTASSTVAEVQLNVDADDLHYLPADCQPWGASARVSDAGGYSPEATRITRVYDAADVVVDSYARTATGTIAQNRVAICETKASKASNSSAVYVEFGREVAATGTQYFGLAPRGTLLGSVGQAFDVSGIAYNSIGAKRQAGVNTAGYLVIPVGGVLGIIWRPALGAVWFTVDGVATEGDPDAGTGAAFTGVTGDLCPAAVAFEGGRVRFLTHVREQRYRPSYAEAWDGADVLPEEHFRGLLGNDPYIRERLHFPVPWGGDSRTGEPIGAIELLNDGRYDALRRYALRNQDLSIYRVDELTGLAESEALALCDRAELRGESAVRVLSRDRAALLDTVVDADIYLLGLVRRADVIADEAGGLVYHVAHTPFVRFGSLQDQGVTVDTWTRRPEENGGGIIRTVNPAGRHSVVDVKLWRPHPTASGSMPLTNGDLSSWSGGNPTGWTTVETGPNALISQSGSAAVFFRNVGAPEASIEQALPNNSHEEFFVKLVVSSYTKGDVQVQILLGGSAGDTNAARISGVGTYYVPLDAGATTSRSLKILTTEDTSLVIDTIELIVVQEAVGANAVRYVLEEHLGWVEGVDFVIPSAMVVSEGGLQTKERPPLRSLLARFLNSVGTTWYFDSHRVMRFVSLRNLFDAPVAELTASDVMGKMDYRPDGAPALSTDARWWPNYAVHSESEIAGSVSAGTRAELLREGKINRLNTAVGGASDAKDFHPFYSHAVGAAPIERGEYFVSDSPSSLGDPGLYWLHKCYAEMRGFFEATYKAASCRALRLGDVVTQTYPRYELSDGKDQMIVGKDRSLRKATTKLIKWG